MVAFTVPEDGRLSWRGGSAGVQRDSVTRNFGYADVPMRVTCADGRTFLTEPTTVPGYKALCKGSRLAGAVADGIRSGDTIESVPDTSPP